MSALNGSDPELSRCLKSLTYDGDLKKHLDFKVKTTFCDPKLGVKVAKMCDIEPEAKLNEQMVIKREHSPNEIFRPSVNGTSAKTDRFFDVRQKPNFDDAKENNRVYIRNQSIFLTAVLCAIFLYIFSLTLFFLLLAFFSVYFEIGAALFLYAMMLFFPLTAVVFNWSCFVVYSTFYCSLTCCVLIACAYVQFFATGVYEKLKNATCLFIACN